MHQWHSAFESPISIGDRDYTVFGDVTDTRNTPIGALERAQQPRHRDITEDHVGADIVARCGASLDETIQAARMTIEALSDRREVHRI